MSDEYPPPNDEPRDPAPPSEPGGQALVLEKPVARVTASRPPLGTARAATRPASRLAGELAPLEDRSLFGLADGLLKTPANVSYELTRDGRALGRFLGVVWLSMALTGAIVASFAGGLQYLVVPLKLSLGLLFGAALCLPSLYILSCLSGTTSSFRSVVAALAMGLGVMALLLVGFAPVAWVFSQSTTSGSLMGTLWLLAFFASAALGLGMTSRVLAGSGTGVSRLWAWKLTFLVVMLQLATNLRPLVGPYEGVALAEKRFFLDHWVTSVVDEVDPPTRREAPRADGAHRTEHAQGETPPDRTPWRQGGAEPVASEAATPPGS